MLTIKKIKRQYYNSQTIPPRRELRGKKIDLLDLELIISRVIKKTREFVLAHPEHQLNKAQNSKCKTQILRRIKGEPLAYIFGDKEFYGLNFKVNKNTLIPRPETELMVDEAIKQLTINNEQLTIIDIGTGSGCIIISLAKNLIKSKLPITNYQFLATDISKPALRVAKQNAQTHKVNKKIKFFHGDLLEPILNNKKLIIDNCKLIIVSNLPYLAPAQIKNSPSIQHEPMLALNAGPDGLKYYRKLFKQIKELKMFCVLCSVFCEIDPKQTVKLKRIIKNNFPKSTVKIKKDLNGHNRLVIVKI